MTNSEAIEVLKANYPDPCFGLLREAVDTAIYALSAKSERLSDDDFETIRIHLNAYKENLCNQQRWEEAEEYQRIIDRFMAFASAEPEERALHESCTDCPLYDHERHSCPRFNKVIPETLREVQPEQRWIPTSERLPEEDGGLYLVTDYAKSINRRRMHLSRCYMNKEGFWSDVLLGYKVIAWMPLPEPYHE